MSFQSMTVAELRQVADSFGVDLTNVKGKSMIVGAIEADGVSYDMYNTIVMAQKEDYIEPEKPQTKEIKGNAVLVRMERNNGTYETHGLRFTKDHPYALTDEETAQSIFEREEGFRPATPKELQEFYS